MIQEFKVWIKNNRNRPLKEIMFIYKRKLTGHYNYYGISDNIKSCDRYLSKTREIMFKWLNRRSQRRSYNWEQFKQMMNGYNLPTPNLKVSIFDI